MKRTWKTLLAGLALAFFAGAALADPPQNVIFDQNQEKLPAGPIGAAVPQPVQFDADNRHNSDTGLQAGAALHILKPVINNNFAFTTVLASGGNFTNNSQNFKYDFDSAISLWLGYTTDSGLGFRATWFRLETDARGISLTNAFAGAAATPFIFAGTFVPFTGVPLAAGQADVFNLSNRIKIDSWDLDVSQQLHICKFDLNVGMGLRYARITQDANISRTRTGLAGGAVNFENELDSNSYNGWGPTAFVEAKRRLGDTGLALYGNARGGVLLGRAICLWKTARQSVVLPQLRPGPSLHLTRTGPLAQASLNSASNGTAVAAVTIPSFDLATRVVCSSTPVLPQAARAMSALMVSFCPQASASKQPATAIYRSGFTQPRPSTRGPGFFVARGFIITVRLLKIARRLDPIP